MRALVLLLSFTLAACGSQVEVEPLTPYVPPSMPATDAAIAGIKQAVAEEKITGPIEMSDLRTTDHGPGRLCSAHAAPRQSYLGELIIRCSSTTVIGDHDRRS